MFFVLCFNVFFPLGFVDVCGVVKQCLRFARVLPCYSFLLSRQWFLPPFFRAVKLTHLYISAFTRETEGLR